jgi:predicted RNase H-like HicB family nuclease
VKRLLNSNPKSKHLHKQAAKAANWEVKEQKMTTLAYIKYDEYIKEHPYEVEIPTAKEAHETATKEVLQRLKEFLEEGLASEAPSSLLLEIPEYGHRFIEKTLKSLGFTLKVTELNGYDLFSDRSKNLERRERAWKITW